ncbi:MAG: TPR end-of-group domain-containing protein [Gaiellaceae bacterium]
MATTQTGFAVVPIAEIEQGAVADGRVRHKVREQFGIEGFGANAYRALEAGATLINEHTETSVASNGQEELYVVLTGKATFTVDGDEIDAPAGTFVYVKPDAKRGAVADEAETAVLVVGGAPGQAYNQSPSFLVAPMFGPYQDDDFAGAAAILRDVLAEHPNLPLGLYNLACCESRLGEQDAALEHLAASIESEGRFKDLARDDDDFEALRDEPRFRELVA